MFQRLVPVSRERHAGKRVKALDGFAFARGFHVVSLMMHEFVRATPFYPIIFIDDAQAGVFRPVALLGLEAGENLFVDDRRGTWLAGAYIPGIVRRYPFALANTETGGEFAVCVDEGSPLFGEAEGMPLFGDDGAPTETLENVKRYLGELQQMDALTTEFSAFLGKHNLLRPLNLRVRAGAGTRDIGGSYVVNEERLEALSDEAFLQMRKLRYLPAIYAHLSSIPQVDRLVRLKESSAPAGSEPTSPVDASAPPPVSEAPGPSASGQTVGDASSDMPPERSSSSEPDAPAVAADEVAETKTRRTARPRASTGTRARSPRKP